MKTFKINNETTASISGKLAAAIALIEHEDNRVLFPDDMCPSSRADFASSYIRDARDLARLLRDDLDSINALGFSAQDDIEHGRLDDAARALKDQSRAIRSALYIVGRKSDLAYYGVDDDA